MVEVVVEGIVGLSGGGATETMLLASVVDGWLGGVETRSGVVVPICCAGTVVSGAVVVASMGPDIAGNAIKQTK